MPNVGLRLRASLACGLMLLGACSSAPSGRTKEPVGPRAAAPPAPEEDRWLIASVPRGTLGPHWAERGEERLALWALTEGKGAGWFTLALPEGQSPGAALRIADVPAGLSIVRLRPDGASGFVALTTRAAHDAHLVESLKLGPEGVLRSGPHVLGESPAPILWMDAVTTSRGSLVVWAERAGAHADLYAVPAGPLGAERAPRRIARRASAWQLAAFGRSAALATVEESDGGRQVVVRFIGDDGEEAAPRAVVATGGEPSSDIDLLVTQKRALVAWSEQQPAGRRVLLAQLELDGSLSAEPWPLSAPRGDQRLMELVGDAEGRAVYVAWEEAAQRPLVGSNVQLARVGNPGVPIKGPAAELHVGAYDGTLPMFAATPRGVLAVTRARACPEQEPSCEGDDNAIMLTELDAALTPLGASPVRRGSSAPPELLWEMRCGDACWALTARSDATTHVYLERLAVESGWRSPATAYDRGALPRLQSQAVLGPTMDLAGLVGWLPSEGAQSASATLAWLSYFDPTTPWVVPAQPAPDGRRAPVRAVLRHQTFAGQGAPGSDGPSSEETLSWRAHSLGGLAVAPGAGEEKLLVWAALDNHEPQVFATVVDGRGKRVRQRMITRAPGEVLDVAAVRLDAGWLVSWIDGRGETAEIYTVRLDDKLASSAPERPLGSGAQRPTGVQLLRRGDSVLVAWSDARGEQHSAHGDVHLAVISAGEGSVVAPPRRVAATALHSHSPRLVPSADGAVLAWLESGMQVEEAPPGAFMSVELDESGRFSGGARTVPLDGRPTAFGMSCPSTCRVVLSLDAGSRNELWGLELGLRQQGGGQAGPRLLSALAGRHAGTVAPVLLGESVVYVDAAPGREPQLHRLGVVWQ